MLSAAIGTFIARQKLAHTGQQRHVAHRQAGCLPRREVHHLHLAH
jgi:hypothetical protein